MSDQSPRQFPRRRAHLLALEPRMMFDAAAAVTMQALAADNGDQHAAMPGFDHPGDAAPIAKASFSDTHTQAASDSPVATPATPATIDPDAPSSATPAIDQRDTAATSAERPNAYDAPLTDARAHPMVESRDPLTVSTDSPVDPGTAPAAPPHDVIFIDTSVDDYRQLAAEWADKGQVILIDGTKDGIDQIRAALAGQSDIGAIHIVSHGAEGVLWLGTTRVDEASINGDLSSSLGAIGRSLAPGGDILLYGCDFAEGADGASALAAFARATHADVAASTDVTGYAGRGGDWTLEAQSGSIEAHALSSGDWVHTLDPNTPVPISVTADSLTVIDGNGNTVVTGTTGYGSDARSPDVGVGAVAIWSGAATFNGQSVDLRATVVSISTGDAIRFNRPTGTGLNGDDPTFLLRDLTTANDATVQIRWELVLSGTNTPLPADVRFTIADIDGIGGNPNTRESVTAATPGLAYFTRERVSDINFTSSLSAITASGTQNENTTAGQPLSPQSAATFDWSAVSSFTLSYKLTTNTVTSQAQFYHDGDADFIYNDPVYVSVPRLDLDGNDSTATGNDAHFTFTENGAAVPIVDGDLVVSNPMDINSITGASVQLTNYHTGDTFAVGTLPSNIAASIGPVTGGAVTITLSGLGSEADYTAALKAISFSNTSDTPDPTQRVINIAFSNNTLTSATATSRIDVIPVNDPPVAVNDSASTNEDTSVTIAVLTNDSDPEGDALTVTAATALHGSVVRNANGTLTYTPNANYNGSDTISYTISDGNGGTASATVAVTIAPVNDAPTRVGTLPARSTSDAATVSYTTAGGFTDVDGDTLTYSATGLPTGLTINSATGVISGTIDRSASQTNGGNYSVVVTARDPSNASTTQTFAIAVANPAPSAVNDTASTPEDTAVTIAVLANDSDPDGDPLTVTAASALHGTVVRNANGTLTYTPNANYNGSDTISYTISDGQGGTSSATVAVTIEPQADAPVNSTPGPQTVAEDTTLTFSTANGNAISIADVDGGQQTVTLSATHGTLTLGGIAGLTFTVGDGTGDATMTFTGTIAAINAALDGTAFAPAADYNGAAQISLDVATVPVTGEDFTNGDLEAPGIPANTNAFVMDTSVPGWRTTATDHKIEVWSTGYQGVPAYQGNQYFEVNGTQAATLYQDFRSVAGSAITVDFAHRGRQGADTMQVTAIDLGADGIFGTGDDVVLSQQQYTDGNTAWGAYTQQVTNSATGDLIRIQFSSISTSTGNPTIGNFIDGIALHQASVPMTAHSDIAITVTPVVDIANDSTTTPEDTAVVIAPLDNDSFEDPSRSIVAIDGQAISVGGPAVTVANGTVQLDAAQHLTFTPTANYNGTTTFTYTVSSSGITETATETVVVTPVNDAPVPAGTLSPVATSDGSAINVPTAGSFTDADGDALTYSATGLPTGLTINALTGVISGSIDRSASQAGGGVYNVVVTARDPSNATATQPFTINVTNPGPTAVDDSATTPQDTAIVVAVLANDSDPDGDPLTVTAATALHGSVVRNSDGTLTYTPNAGYRGSDTISYAISDGQGGTANAIVAVTVTPVNHAPVAVGDSASTIEDMPVTVTVLTNDSDPDGDPLTVTAATALHGSVARNPDGTLTYTPNANYNGSDTISYTISDGLGGTANATVAITIAAVNDAPAPVGTLPARDTSDAATVSYPTAGGFSDADGDTLTYSASGLPVGLTIDSATGVISGTIDRSASQANGGVYNVVVTARDPSNATSTQGFAITVANPAPVAVNDSATTNEDTAVTIAVLANDSDPDGDPLTVTAATALHGSVVRNVDGTLTYTPDANYNGNDTISYTISDGQGGTSNATVAITITPVNDVPMPAGTLPSRSTLDGASPSYPTAGGFSDVDGDALTYSASGLPAGLSIDAATGIISGTVDRSASQANSGTYSVTVTARDPSGATATQGFAIAVANPGPVAVDDLAATRINTPVTVTVLDNDSDPDGDPLAVTAATALNGTVVRNADGTLTYTPNAGYVGRDTVNYTISDGEGGTADATLTIDVANTPPTAGDVLPVAAQDGQAISLPIGNRFSDPDGDPLTYTAAGLPPGLSIDPATGVISGTIAHDASAANGGVYDTIITADDGHGGTTSATLHWTVGNPAPNAVNDSATTAEDTPVIIPVLANDSDPDGDTLSVVAASAAHGTVAINPDGTITYTPDRDFNGSDTISYTIADSDGGRANASVAVTVSPVNDAPATAGLPPRTTLDGVTVNAPVAPAFDDADGDPITYAATGLPPGLSIDPTTGVISGTITPGSAYGGPAADGVYHAIVTATDPSGASSSAPFDWTISQTAPNAVDDRATTPEDMPVSIPVLANDTDADADPLTIVDATATHGTVTIAGGNLVFTPAANFNGVATIVYTVTDPSGNRATATVTIDVTPVNDAPVADPLPGARAADGTPVQLDLGGYFSDADGDPLTYSVSGLPAGLAIDPATGRISGSIDRAASQVTGGLYRVTITATDPSGASVSSSFDWTIVNPAPTAANDIATTAEDQPVVIAVLANDSDPDGDPLSVVAADAGHGLVSINPDGTINYTPDRDFNGNDVIVYTISDGNGGMATASVLVTVTPVNDAPVAANDTATTPEDTAVDIAVLANDRDADGDPLTITAANAGHGTVSVNPDGSLHYVPVADYNGSDTISYTIDDGHGGTATATVAITVTPVQDAPVATPDTARTSEDTPVVIAVLANDRDVDGDALTVTAATAQHGVVTINPDGTITYAPAANFNGTDTIAYSISDGKGGTANTTVTVTVDPVNDAPAPISPAPAARNTTDGATLSIDAAALFTDADGDALSFTATGLPAGLSIDATGAITGTIDRSASQSNGGVYTVTVTARDPSNATGSVTFTINVANPTPVAVADSARTSEDTGVVIPVLTNDSDPDGDPLTVIAATAANGTATINPDGTVSYLPGPNFAGTDTIRYTISDGQGGSATAIVTVVVDPVNDAPIISGRDPVDAVGGRPVLINPLIGVTDPDGDPLTLTSATSANGVVVVNRDGTIAFTPALGFVGTTTITFTVSDGQGGTASGTIVVRVADGTGADLNQLLHVGQVSFRDPSPRLATIALTDGVVRNPLSLIDTAEAVRSLRSTGIGAQPVGDAVAAIGSLNSTFIDPDKPVTAEVARLDALRDLRDAGDRLFDQRWGDFMVKGFSGFSAAADRNACIMVESVVRGGAIYVEVRDMADEGTRAPIRSVDIRLAGGGKVPDWIKVDPRGLAIIEPGANMDELHLVVRVTRTDGRTSSTPILIQGSTGEIELDRQYQIKRHAQKLDATLTTPSAAAKDDADRLSTTFE